MRRQRALVTAAALVAGLAVSACTSTSDWGDKIQDTLNDMNLFGTAKKPLPGERKSVFPQGVPGVTQGVPAELVQGNQANAAPFPVAQPAPVAPPPPKKKKVKVARKKPPPPPPGANPPPDDVWPQPQNSPPPDGVWPPPPR